MRHGWQFYLVQMYKIARIKGQIFTFLHQNPTLSCTFAQDTLAAFDNDVSSCNITVSTRNDAERLAVYLCSNALSGGTLQDVFFWLKIRRNAAYPRRTKLSHRAGVGEKRETRLQRFEAGADGLQNAQNGTTVVMCQTCQDGESDSDNGNLGDDSIR